MFHWQEQAVVVVVRCVDACATYSLGHIHPFFKNKEERRQVDFCLGGVFWFFKVDQYVIEWDLGQLSRMENLKWKIFILR